MMKRNEWIRNKKNITNKPMEIQQNDTDLVVLR